MTQTASILPVVALCISASAFLFSILSFAWQHWRKVDAVVGTLVASECDRNCARFQFSFANLGTRPVLLREVSVEVFMNPNWVGEVSNDCSPIDCKLPQVIKPGEMLSISVESKWTLTFLVKAAKQAEDCGKKNAVLYFVAKAVCWNPKGVRLVRTKQIATFTHSTADTGCAYQCLWQDRVFRLKKQRYPWSPRLAS